MTRVSAVAWKKVVENTSLDYNVWDHGFVIIMAMIIKSYLPFTMCSFNECFLRVKRTITMDSGDILRKFIRYFGLMFKVSNYIFWFVSKEIFVP